MVSAEHTTSSTQPTASPLWFQSVYRRLLFDMHIHDHDPRYLSEFDPAAFVEAVKTANAQMVTVPANGHTGLCYWPTQTGQEHRTVAGRDILGQLLAGLKQAGLRTVVYYCAVYVDWYWEQHPEARVVDASGDSPKLLMLSSGNPRRFSVVCMNNPGYRDFVVAQLTELCQRYDFDSVWPDMTFWPTVCYCAACQKRYADEVGGELPRVIDWTDARWVAFQRKREEWVRDFSHLITATIHRLKPGVTVSHQSQTFNGDWLLGPSVELSRESDWLAADLYADRPQLSFYSKLYYDLSQYRPFEHLNTWCYPNIFEHLVPRSEAHLEAVTFSALMNQGALAFIDNVDPLGTINPANYARAGRVFSRAVPYEPHIGGTMQRDVAIYFSFPSQINLDDDGQPVTSAGYNFEPDDKPLATNNAVSAAKILLNHHIPYGAITRKNLADLGRYAVILLPDQAMLDTEEVEALRAYVHAGGSLFATRHTSLLKASGAPVSDFALADVFGVHYSGETSEITTYVDPTAGYEDLFEPFTRRHPVTLYGKQVKVKADEGVEVLATVTLPFTDPKGAAYASILTNPPGIPTEFPALALHRYGSGKALYAAGSIETWEHETQRAVFARLLRRLMPGPDLVETSAPASVEVVVYDQSEQQRVVVNLLSFQAELPNIPLHDVIVSLRLDGRTVSSVVELPSEIPLAWSQADGRVSFTLPRLETFAMIGVQQAFGR